MKIDDIKVGERYEVIVGYRGSSETHFETGRYEGEVTEKRVYRRIFRDGYWQASKRPDGVEVELLVDGEAFPDNVLAVGTKDIVRLWSEKLAEVAARDEEKRKLQRKQDIERLRSSDANGIFTTVLGKLVRRTLDHRGERVAFNINSYDRHKPSSGTLYFESVNEAQRLAHLVEMGLEHEKSCLKGERGSVSLIEAEDFSKRLRAATEVFADLAGVESPSVALKATRLIVSAWEGDDSDDEVEASVVERNELIMSELMNPGGQ